MKMLKKRGYNVLEDELDMTPQRFKEKFNLGQHDTPPRDNLTLLVEKHDDQDDQIFVFFPDDPKVGVKPIRNYCNMMKEETVTKAIIVVQDGITPFAKQALAEMAPRYKIEHFREEELLVDITEHTLVPKHIVLTQAEKEELLTRYKLKDTQLPRVQQTDPVAKYFGLNRGQIVKIVRNSETAGRYVTYRICW
jgi:DNA-directed RNA polymerase I, II, and III subunit RPABC1